MMNFPRGVDREVVGPAIPRLCPLHRLCGGEGRVRGLRLLPLRAVPPHPDPLPRSGGEGERTVNIMPPVRMALPSPPALRGRGQGEGVFACCPFEPFRPPPPPPPRPPPSAARPSGPPVFRSAAHVLVFH